MDDNHLLDSKDWSALFLCENGEIFEEALAQCPRTWEAVQAAPLPRMANSPTIMFFLLRAGARIASHTATHNARLICHLPLIVPPNCGFRVGNEIRQWEEAKLLIFDDGGRNSVSKSAARSLRYSKGPLSTSPLPLRRHAISRS
jgi:aspartyl/asparaginyl beta-hydroxylase (cupin superfamily)